MLIGIIVTPYYIKHLGSESYGLVAFFTMLTTWMNLLDLGISPTLGREVASAKSSPNGLIDYKKLLRSFEMIFLGISILVSLSIYLLSNRMAIDWIKSIDLNKVKIAKCISLMGVLIALRWFSSLYRSVIIGFEEHVRLNILNILFISLKFVGALILIKFFSSDIFLFFLYQLFLGVIEILFLTIYVYKLLPRDEIKIPFFSFYWSNVKVVIPFALSVAFTSIIWLFVSQVDKLILSSVLNLREFGYFNLVVVISSTITTLIGPISQAVLPRMVYLFSINKTEEMYQLYKNATQMVTLISGTLTLVIVVFSQQIVYAWTGNIEAAIWAKDVLFWYALGCGVLNVLSFQYYLQVAIGQLKLHVKGGILSLLVDVPIIVFVSIYYGAEAVGIVWFVLRVIWFLFWTPFIHSIYAPGIHKYWILNDVFKIVLPLIFAGFLVKYLIPTFANERIYIGLNIFIVGLTVFFYGCFFSTFIRKTISDSFKTLYVKFKN